jgi:transcriptional regulator of acetoin/glycerol metabolism
LAGLLNVNCPYTFTNGLLLPFVTELARSIEAQLRATASRPEQELIDEFMRVSKRGAAVVALSQELFIANAAARTLLRGVDIELLRNWACDAAVDGRERTAELRLRPDLVVSAHRRPLAAAGQRGSVVVLTPAAAARGSARAAARGPVPAGRSPRREGSARPLEQLARAYAARRPVVLRGERGTGKTTLARRLHDRADPAGRLTILDVSTLGAVTREVRAQEWLRQLERALADPSGAVLLRHLDDLPLAFVTRMTSMLDAPRARLAATVTDRPDGATHLAGVLERFAVVVDVPPLRERSADLPALITEIIADLHPPPPQPRCTPEALATLNSGEWPGNLRQLRQVLATALVRSGSADITVDDLPDELAAARQRHLTRLERLERQALVIALRDAEWDREAAARELGISRATIYRKLKRFGIPVPVAYGESPAQAEGSPAPAGGAESSISSST